MHISRTPQSSINMQEIIMDYRRGCSSLLEELVLLLPPDGSWLLILFLHWFTIRSSLFFLPLSIFPWITGQKTFSCHMAKIMACITLHMEKIRSKRIEFLVVHAWYKPCMQHSSPQLVRFATRCLMAKHVTWIAITIKTMIIPIGQSLGLLIQL